MSKYEKQSDSSDVICPYCGDSYQCEAEDYCESEIEEECDNCGNNYHRVTIFSVTHQAKPDCELNFDSDHQWEPLSIGKGGTHDFCSVCGKCRPTKPSGTHGNIDKYGRKTITLPHTITIF